MKKTDKDKNLLVEKIYVKKNHPMFKTIDDLAFRCKNLYNTVLYKYRQIHFQQQRDYKEGNVYKASYPHWKKLAPQMLDNDDYRNVGNTKISQMIIQSAYNDWSNWLKSLVAYHKNKTLFDAKPRIPKYKDPVNGRAKIVHNNQCYSKPSFENGLLKLSLIDYEFELNKSLGCKIREISITKDLNRYSINICYEKILDIKSNHNENGEVFKAGIDLGLNVLSAIATSSGVGKMIDGKPLKHINNRYNKLIAKAQSLLPKGVYTSEKIMNLHNRRKNKIKDYMHKASTVVVNGLYDSHVNEIYIGHNKGWKNGINLGKENNRKFVFVPFGQYIHMLTYKAERKGMKVTTTEEAYTSKASALDKDQLFKYGEKEEGYTFSGNRTKRGLYITKHGHHVHADMNGAMNILRKHDLNVDSLDEVLKIGCLVRPEYVRFEV